MADYSLTYTLDEALSSVGFGNFQCLALFFAGVGWISDAMEMMLLSFIGPAVQSDWNLSPSEESFLSTVVFAGMLVGSYFWGLLSDSYGRRKGILGSLMVMVGAGILSAFSPTYASLVILRGLLGFGLGGGQIFALWFIEFIPVQNRGMWMILFTSFWTLGTISEASLGWIIMPRLGWRWLVGFSMLPSLTVLLISGFIPESPRTFTEPSAKKGKNLYMNVFITSLAEAPGLTFSAIMVDKVGWKLTLKITCVLGFTVLLPLILPQNEMVTTALLFGARMFVMATYSVLCTYAREVHPTSVRSVGVGIASSMGRIGGMICPFVAVGLVRGCHQAAAVILLEVVILLLGLCVLFFPFDTRGRKLTMTHYQITSKYNKETVMYDNMM